MPGPDDYAAGVLAPLLLWLSPAFPVGAFAFSHGLEWAVGQGWVADRSGLGAWLEDLFAMGSARNDMILTAAAWRAAAKGDDNGLLQTADLAVALQPSAERRLETITQGRAFLAQAAAVWPCPAVATLCAGEDNEIAYPVAVGAAAAGHRLPLGATLFAYGLAAAGNLVSAALRLGVVGQTDGQRVLAALVPAIEAAARHAVCAELEDLGGAAWRADLASCLHETQYTRLFRS